LHSTWTVEQETVLTFQIDPIYTMGNEQATIIWFVDNDEVIQECLGGFSDISRTKKLFKLLKITS